MRLRQKLNLSLLAVLLTTLLVYAVGDIYTSQSTLKDQALEAARNTEERLAITLSDSMWNYNLANAKKIASAELGTNNLVGITAYDLEDKPLFSIHWDQRAHEMREGPYEGETLLRSELPITFEDAEDVFEAGRVTLSFSDASLQQAMTTAIKRNLLQVAILSITLLLAMGYLISRLVLTPLDNISRRVKDIALGEGDLTKRVNIESRDELGDLAEGINQFIDNVHRIIRDVRGLSETLDQSSEKSRQDITELNSLVSDLGEKVAYIVQAMQDLATTSKEVAREAVNSADVMQDTNKMAERGVQDIEQANTQIRDLAASVQESTDNTSKLDGHSQEIGRVIDVIKAIAEQINLLALNAAIEAARAGEQGRGFSVVADEVRTLAQRTQSSTGEIEDIISQLQAQAKDTHNTMNLGLEKAQQNVEAVAKAGASFTDIEQAVAKSLDAATTIATAAEEQSQTLGAMEEHIGFIQNANERTQQIAKESQDSNQEVVSLSHKVAALIEKFKTD